MWKDRQKTTKCNKQLFLQEVCCREAAARVLLTEGNQIRDIYKRCYTVQYRIWGNKLRQF